MRISFPRVSLVTPSLNQGKFIRATIESVLSQEYPNLDYRVQDGGSTDETLVVLREYEARVAFVSEKDRGQADAINRGLSRANGEVLGYLNSDDVLLPGALSAVGEAFASDPELMFVWGRAAYLDEAGNTVSQYLVRPDAIERLADACFIAQPAAFLRRKVWEEIGPFDESLHHTMDYDYWLRIAERYPQSKMRFLDRELAGCRMHADAKTVAGWTRALDEIFALVKKRTGYVSLWWCVAKWDHLTDGRSQATEPHPVPWRAYPPAILEFLRLNPVRLWPRGLKNAAAGFWKRHGLAASRQVRLKAQ
jgi:glycosyltransferase involved in cell wall biosynthesis